MTINNQQLLLKWLMVVGWTSSTTIDIINNPQPQTWHLQLLGGIDRPVRQEIMVCLGGALRVAVLGKHRWNPGEKPALRTVFAKSD